MAKLYFRYGAMNSGKSTALMQVAHNYEEQGMRVLILKPRVDTKGGDELVSRLGVRRKVDCLIPPEMDVFEVVRAAAADGPLACVLCDESQFFTAAQAEQLFAVTVELNVPVDLLRPAHRFFPQGIRRLYPSAGAGPHGGRDEDHLHLRPQGPVQCPQGERSVYL